MATGLKRYRCRLPAGSAPIDDLADGYPYQVRWSDRTGRRHRYYTRFYCAAAAWTVAEDLAQHPDTARVVIDSAPRGTIQ